MGRLAFRKRTAKAFCLGSSSRWSWLQAVSHDDSATRELGFSADGGEEKTLFAADTKCHQKSGCSGIAAAVNLAAKK